MMQRLIEGTGDNDAVIIYSPIIDEKDLSKKAGEVMVYPVYATLEFDRYISSMKNILQRIRSREQNDLFGTVLADQIENEISFCERRNVKKINSLVRGSSDELDILQYPLPTMTLEELMSISGGEFAIVEVEPSQDIEVCIDRNLVAMENYFAKRINILRKIEQARLN